MDRTPPSSPKTPQSFADVDKSVANAFRSKLVYQRKSSSDSASGPAQIEAMASSAIKLKRHIALFRSLRSAKNLALNACIENRVRNFLYQLMANPQKLSDIRKECTENFTEMNILAASYLPRLDQTDITYFGLSEFLDVMDRGNVADGNRLKLALLPDLTTGQQDHCIDGMANFVRRYWQATPQARTKLLGRPDDAVKQFCQAWVECKDKKALLALPGCNQAITEIAEHIAYLDEDFEAALSSSFSDAGSGEAPSTRIPRNPRLVEHRPRTRSPKNPRSGNNKVD